jgi:RNA polymerase sigma-70 factor, ECF subfamily
MRPQIGLAIELIRKGDRASIDEALRLLQTTVFSFSMKVCGHREDAEDTMQDVLLKSVSHLKGIESPQALAVWLYKVTRNRCWMSRRRSKFAPQHTLSLDELMPDSQELESLTHADGRNPESEFVTAERGQQLHRAVLRIPAKYRLILVLHDMEELDTSDVAKITGLTEGTVRVRLHRARLFVRRELQQSSQRVKNKPRKSRKPLDCRKMFAGLSEFIDGRVDDISCQRIQRHLRDCPACLAFIEDLNKAVNRCRQYEVPCEPRTANKVRKLLLQEFLRASGQDQLASRSQNKTA